MSDGTKEFVSQVHRPISVDFCVLSLVSTGGHRKRKLIGSKYILHHCKDGTINSRGHVALALRFEKMCSLAELDLIS